MDTPDTPEMCEQLVIFQHGLAIQNGIDGSFYLVVHGKDVPTEVSSLWVEDTRIQSPLNVIRFSASVTSLDRGLNIGREVMP